MATALSSVCVPILNNIAIDGDDRILFDIRCEILLECGDSFQGLRARFRSKPSDQFWTVVSNTAAISLIFMLTIFVCDDAACLSDGSHRLIQDRIRSVFGIGNEN